MNDIAIGDRLRAARTAMGFSQQYVSEVIGVSRTAVLNMETGKRKVSTMEIVRLAELYRHPLAWFLENTPLEDEPMVELHRADARLKNADPENRRQINECINLCREGVTLKKMLGREQSVAPPHHEIPLPRSAGEAVMQGDDVARDERRRLGIGNFIIGMSGLINSQGIWASAVELPDNMSGIFLHSPAIGMAIMVNASHRYYRKQFSYAHEYGHALMDRKHKALVSSNANSDDLVEKRANSFAASFLMPEDGVRELLRSFNKGRVSRQESAIYNVAGDNQVNAEIRTPASTQRISYMDVANVARSYGASYQAAAYRLKNLGCISRTELDELLQCEEHGKKYIRIIAAVPDRPLPPEHPYQDIRKEVANLALEAYQREVISRGRLMELVRVLDINEEAINSVLPQY